MIRRQNRLVIFVASLVTEHGIKSPHLSERLLDLLGGERAESALEVGLQSGRRLVGELYAAVQDPDRDSVGRIGGQEEPEGAVTAL